MKKLQHLFDSNRSWADKITEENPDFFATLAKQQAPDYLWIGCSDSRVPANEIVGMLPGDIFVHRNVSNLVIHTDMNCLSVIQYAVTVLKVKHIMVVGHYGCGGVRAAIESKPHGLIDNWLRHIRDIDTKHRDLLSVWSDQTEYLERLCELNVIEQAYNVCNTTIAQEAWGIEQELSVHAWVYGLDNGLVRDLNFCISDPSSIESGYHEAVESINQLASAK
ncbi:carbonate dehydratase [Neptunomonas japonica]|uniref:Carbonic anhydrase n=1 Tax=Neptunomonas japonica JAMM 1380 TaxID=1441457 RepID=A0A7R6SV44_9GAMM|nr:carbonate dehydratase [Neptunomonas japonica]BBB28337.1 carbonic anhydrase [Neptunomonas japonica JAMM 1380]